MKLQQLFETKNELGFNEKYTREDNPEAYYYEIVLPAGNVSSFDEFPKLLATQYIDIESNKFTDFIGFPKIKDEVKGPLSVIADDNPLTSLEGLPDIVYKLQLNKCQQLVNLNHCPKIIDALLISRMYTD